VRVFLDANVLFSAAYRDRGSVRAFFALAKARACTLVASAYAIEETRRNVALKPPQRMSDLEALVAAVETCPEPSAATLAWASRTGLRDKDAPILAAAVGAHCHILATGDRTDFAPLFGQRVRGTLVMLPADAIGLLIGTT
jgi:predicted nucleic acid-binding protein